MATPEIAVNCLQKLLNFNDLDILAVVTQPDRPCGRGKKMTAPAVKEFADRHNIKVFQTESIKNDVELLKNLKELNPDFFITFAFGQILTQDVLDIPKIATVNVHASLLPKYRGANPIQRAIYNGEEETGITTMITALALDAGDICLQEKIKITPDMTDTELAQIISDKAPFVLYPTLKQLYNGILKPQKQDDSQMTLAKKFKKEDSVINWHQSAQQIHNHVRCMTMWPVACTKYNGSVIKILKTEMVEGLKETTVPGKIPEISKAGILVETGEGVILIKELKPEGKSKMDAYAWSNGAKISVGSYFE